MDVFLVRVFLFTLLPLLLGAGIILFDRTASNRLRRIEAVLIPLFVVGLAGSGIGSFFGHFFMSDTIAESIGWETGSPFQLEIAFANLALGLLGAIAAARRDGFREATVIAVTVFGVGASLVHIMDVVQTGNLASGNSVPMVANLIKPAFLIGLLIISRRVEEGGTDDKAQSFDEWRHAIVMASAVVVMGVSAAFGIGFAFERTVTVSLLGTAVAATVFVIMLARSSAHRAPATCG